MYIKYSAGWRNTENLSRYLDELAIVRGVKESVRNGIKGHADTLNPW